MPRNCCSFVIGPPSGYDNAYFEVDYVRVFSAQGTNTVVSNSSSASTPSSSGKSGAAGRWAAGTAVWAAVGGLAALVLGVAL